MKKIFQLAIMACTALSVHATDYTRGLSIWFDTPNTLVNKAVWFGNTPNMWKGENKPESAGDTATNPDAGWESQSLPIGNGSLGANIMGSVEAERITFNEKTLWRGGPNTSAGATAYWNVNKPSAHILDEIRQAFTDGNEKKGNATDAKELQQRSTLRIVEREAIPFRKLYHYGRILYRDRA